MKTEMLCPHCKIELRTVTPNGALSCSSCDGGFCSRSTLAALLRQVEISPPAGTYARPSSSVAGPIRYVSCPVCSELMLRRNFGETSGVVVDVCSSHGVWFDRGELGRILEFCGGGSTHYDSGGTTTPSQESIEALCMELAEMLGLSPDRH
jgi:Zn-finger nucleic acid-binding protein